MSAAVARPQPSREQLQLAFRQISRPGWPATLDEALARPHYAACLHGIAVNLSRASPCVAPARPRAAPPAPHAPAHTARPGHTAQRFDARRAAANDFDKD